MSTPLAPRDANARGDDAGTREKRFDADVDDARARRASRPRRVSFKTMDDRGEVAPTVDLKTARGETRARDGAENDATDATGRDEREERGLTKTLARGDGAVGTTTRLAQLRAARAAAAAAAAAGGKPAGAYAPRASRRERLRLRRGTGREVRARPFVIRVNIPGIMKQKSSSDMDVSNGSGGEAFSAPNGVSIVEIGEDSHASAGSGSGSGGSNVNPFTVNTGSMDGPRPMFRPSTHILHDAAATPNGSKSKAGRLSSAGTPNAAEALAMMMHAEYPEGLPEEMQGVSHFANSQRDEPPLADFYGEEDMDLGYDDVAAYDDDGFPEPPAPRKRTTAGVPHKRLRAEMERRKSLALAGLQATEGGVRRSTRQRSKPLEYWRGETKVYQRVHNSLPTVTQIERRTANPIWPRKTPGGPSQPFRVSRLRPAEALRDLGGSLPDPSPLDRRGVRYGLMPPPPPASWAERYGINPLSTSIAPAPGRGVPLMREEDVDEDALRGGAKKQKKRGRKPKAVKEAEERAANEAFVASTVANIMSNVIAANRSPEEIAEDEAQASKDVIEAEVVVATEELDDDEAERQAEREADEAVAEVERELAAELAAEAAAEAEEEGARSIEEERVVEEAPLDVSELEDVVELNTDFTRVHDAAEATTTTTTTSQVVEEPATVAAPVELDAQEETPLQELEMNDDPMDVDAPPSVLKATPSKTAADENVEPEAAEEEA